MLLQHANCLILCFSCGVRSEPLFPDGVGELVSSISRREQAVASGAGEEPAILDELVQRSSTELRDDLVEEAVTIDLKEARAGVWRRHCSRDHICAGCLRKGAHAHLEAYLHGRMPAGHEYVSKILGAV